MKKRITTLSTDPYSISLSDRAISLFVDPKSAAIFVDEGEGEDRMNGAVFSPSNRPSFSVRELAGSDSQLVLNYCGTAYFVGESSESESLRSWAASANKFLAGKSKLAEVSLRAQTTGLARLAADAVGASGK